MSIIESPLGKPTQYIDQYSPDLLFSIAREEKRSELNLNYLQFLGEDIWNAYEVSWLNNKGVPQVAVAEIRFIASSPYIIESKSLKLYLNSFNQTQFKNKKIVEKLMIEDLTKASGALVKLKLVTLSEENQWMIGTLKGVVIDEVDTEISHYHYSPELLKNSVNNTVKVQEVLVSHLLKSNCLITSQPDWASIQISYSGQAISHEALLKYLVSFRSHNEFHEQCVERIFNDIKFYCAPEKLSVYARYTRRGGLDINPWRSDYELSMQNDRQIRQ